MSIQILNKKLDHDCIKESGVKYDPILAKNMSAQQVFENFPRKQCPICGAVCYVSFEHYIAGDW